VTIVSAGKAKEVRQQGEAEPERRMSVTDRTSSGYIPLRARALDLWRSADPVDAANEAEALLEANEDGRASLEKLRDAPDSSRRVQTICSAALLMSEEDRGQAFEDLRNLQQERFLAILVETTKKTKL
jgi:hypothetical protein